MVESAETVEGWARICADERVSRVVMFRARGGCTVTMCVRARYLPVPHAFVFRGTLAECVAAAAAELVRWPALEGETIGG